MPIYQCWSPQGLVTGAVKTTIAGAITKIHCEFTGAPASFVNVLFHEVGIGDCFVAADSASRSYISGVIRHGRDLETRQAMLRKLSQMWTEVTGQPETELIVLLNEIDPANSIEAGIIVPEPGREQEWLDEIAASSARDKVEES
jgi:phenylpyruvate tautomerase PptA (4-oxalocrotonate tautomerase family)